MDDRLFRTAMGKFATGVTVISTVLEGEAHCMTANAFMSHSLHPKLVLISIGERAKMLERVRKAGKFAVNILSADQEDLSGYFAGQIKEKREIDFDWIHGMPTIPNALANIVCDVHQEFTAGDHTLFFGEAKDIVLNEGAPLTFFDGKYGVTRNKAD